MKVSVPWSLSHYIPLNGLHLLYNPLFYNLPENITEINIWDNVKLHKHFNKSKELCKLILKETSKPSITINDIKREHNDFFWRPNQVLTEVLPGDIEFHHTAPFPSLTRPFIFHCESFAPIFFPFAHEGTTDTNKFLMIKEYYSKIFSNSLCLGVFSHIPETLDNITNFFENDLINKKLFKSNIGLSDSLFSLKSFPPKPDINKPYFLFINSANQNANNFFNRGGHIVLRFWEKYIGSGKTGVLIMRCAKPQDILLKNNGVDTIFVKLQSEKTIIWIEQFVSNHEQNLLFNRSHFFLLPSKSLHSVSIMQALRFGAIPLVTDTVGTSLYVDNKTGVILNGVRDTLWIVDKKLGILINTCKNSHDLDSSLVNQMMKNILYLLENNHITTELRNNGIKKSYKDFSGNLFSATFWDKVIDITPKKIFSNTKKSIKKISKILENDMLEKTDLTKAFLSPTQPCPKINILDNIVSEFGGHFYLKNNKGNTDLHSYSCFSNYYNDKYLPMIITNTIHELNGNYFNNDYMLDNKSLLNKNEGFLNKIKHIFKLAYERLYVTCHSLVSKIINISSKKDPITIIENIFEFNIIKYSNKYYVIPLQENIFSYQKYKNSDYPLILSSYSLSKLLKKLFLHVLKTLD